MMTFVKYLFIYLTLQSSITAQNNIPEIPNIFDLTSSGKESPYKIQWEINIIDNIDLVQPTGRTILLTEYYDVKNGNGRLDIIRTHEMNGTFVYFTTDNETFHVHNGKCDSGHMNDKPDFLHPFVGNYWISGKQNDRIILGPSALLRLLYTLKDKKDPNTGAPIVTYDPSFRNMKFRGYTANLWTATLNNTLYSWIFTDPLSPDPYGLMHMAVPLKIVVSVSNTGTIGTHNTANTHYIIESFTPFTSSNIIPSISIPLGLGCQRHPSSTASSPIPPSLKSGVSFDIEMEIVTGPFIDARNQLMMVYDNGRLMYDATSEFYSWKYDGFNHTSILSPKSTVDSFVEHDDWTFGGFIPQQLSDDDDDENYSDTTEAKIIALATKSIWDTRGGVIYIIDGNEKCITKYPQNHTNLLSLNFGKKYRIPINSPQLFQNNGFKYMKDKKVRGIPVMVFETVVSNMSVSSNESISKRTVVFTHYYFKDNYTKGLPHNNFLLKIGISIINERATYSLISRFTINVNALNINVSPQLKMQTFDVSNCFKEPGQSLWFQIAFPREDKSRINNKVKLIYSIISMSVTPKQFLELLFQKDTIVNYFLNYLYTSPDLIIPPTRVRNVIVDWGNETLYITARLLDRSDYLMDFNPINLTARLVNVREETIVSGLSQCVGPCIESGDDCNYVSYCDNLMCLEGGFDLDTTVIPPMIYVNNCITLQKYIRPDLYKMKTLNTLITDIHAKVISEASKVIYPFSFTINITNSDGKFESLAVTGVKFKSGFQFGIENTGEIDTSNLPLNNQRYYIFQTQRHYNFVPNDKRMIMLFHSDSFLDCEQHCDDSQKDNCHSFSYCGTSQECILSTLYDTNLRLNKLSGRVTLFNSDCVLLTRQFIAEYTRYSKNARIPPHDASKMIKVSGEEECASACSSETTFECLSFEHCDNGNIGPDLKYNCFLHKIHYLDSAIIENLTVPINNNYVNCGHFSRNYLTDFKVNINTKYGSTNGMSLITGVSLEQCAHQCAFTSDNTPCLSFNFCQGKMIQNTIKETVCYISSTYSDDPSTTLYDRQCALYTRPHTIKTIKSNSQQTHTYSYAARAGISIVMMIVGAIVVIGAITLYKKRFRSFQ